DSASGLAVDVRLAGARAVVAQPADGYLVYAGGHESGATVLHRASPDGVEDLLCFDDRPKLSQVSYQLALTGQTKGLRLVSNTLELLDAGGAPRLRVTPPYLEGADGARTDAVLAVEGCAVDRSPAAPWGRAPIAPGATTCTLRVSWDDGLVKYPAV